MKQTNICFFSAENPINFILIERFEILTLGVAVVISEVSGVLANGTPPVCRDELRADNDF